jgi:hypothetical protein
MQNLFTTIFVDGESRVRNQSGQLYKAIIARDQAGLGMTNFDRLKKLLL